jgi:uncharacterized protein (DUF58 family)
MPTRPAPTAALRRWLDRGRRWWPRSGPRRWLDRWPLTPRGLALVVGAALLVVRWGLGRGDLLLLVAGAVGLALGALALLLVVGGSIRTWWSLRGLPALGPLEVEVGRPADTGFSLPALSWWPLLEVRWSIEEPAGEARTRREGGRLVESLVARRRGVGDGIERRIEIRDALGVASVAFRQAEKRAFRALPSRGALGPVEVLRALSRGESSYDPLGEPQGDRVDLRPYVPGDPVRQIAWGIYARTRQLLVRTAERATSHDRRLLLYLVAGPDDEAAAGVARALFESLGPAESWVLGADGSEGEAAGPGEAMDRVLRSARVGADGQGAGLGPFLARQRGESARVVVIAPGATGPWVERVQSALGAVRGARVVLAVDRAGAPPHPGLLRRLLLIPRGDDQVSIDVQRPRDRLAAWSPVVIEREAGRARGVIRG